VHAFFLWWDELSFVFLNTRISGERGRFDAAHELAHLVLHHAERDSDGRDRESEATRFASAFLMPPSGVAAALSEFPTSGNSTTRLITLPDFIELKHRWGVAVSALVYRAHALGLISAWTYRYLFQEIGASGYRSHEPEPMKGESSQVFDKVFDALSSEGKTRADVASAVGLTREELETYVFGLALMPVRGGRDVGRSGRLNVALRVIESPDKD